MLECEVVIQDRILRENLCKCLDVLGEKPDVDGDRVFVSCRGKKRRQVVELFRQFNGNIVRFVDL